MKNIFESETCQRCAYWVDKDYCALKPLFTHTDRLHECDEVDDIGQYHFKDKYETEVTHGR